MNDKQILITGATNGIGLAAAEALAARDVTSDSARSLRAQLQPAITMAEVHQRRW